MSRHQEKPIFNSRDPNNPLVHWFTHEGEKKSIDFGTLTTLAKQHAIKKNRPDLAEDFSQWCVVHNLQRIESGSTKYAHLNKCSWLWSEYIGESFGAKSRVGPKWERASMTVSYDNPILDGESGSFLELVHANELSPEERLIIKEDLALLSNEQVEEILFNDRIARKTNDSLVYEYIVGLCGNLGTTKYKPSRAARDLNLTAKEVTGAVQRLVRKELITKKRLVIHLKEIEPKEQDKKSVA